MLWVSRDGPSWAHPRAGGLEAAGGGGRGRRRPGAVPDARDRDGGGGRGRAQRVAAGQRLVAVEAMKMEHVLTAPVDGTVRELRARPGAAVAKDAVLLVVEADGVRLSGPGWQRVGIQQLDDVAPQRLRRYGDLVGGVAHDDHGRLLARQVEHHVAVAEHRPVVTDPVAELGESQAVLEPDAGGRQGGPSLPRSNVSGVSPAPVPISMAYWVMSGTVEMMAPAAPPTAGFWTVTSR